MRLRSATSLTGRQDPLIILDGTISRLTLADINSEDIERIELVKGAAASSLYGSDAANGVVQVFTKRGSSLAEGAMRVTSRIEVGANNMPSRMQFSHSHAFQVEQSPGYCVATGAALTPNPQVWSVDPVNNYCLNPSKARIVRPDQIAGTPFNVYHDHWDEVVNPGMFWTGYASVGQRAAKTNFNASLENTRNEGVIFGL